MGFITPSHVWEETDSEVTVLVEVKGVPRSSFDVFASSAFLKVNAPPYLFSCDLEGDIDDDACVATIDDRGVEFRCPKANPGTRWGRLRRESTRETKSDVAERRRRSVEAAHARVRAERLAAKEAKAKADKAYQEKQWAIEQKRRETIEARQDAEMALERERIRKWQARTDREAAGLDPDVDSEDDEVAYDSDDDAATRAAKEARTRVAREREFAASVLTPDAVAAAEGPDAARPEESRVPEEALDRMLLEDDDDEAASVEAKAKAEAKAEAEAKAKARAATRPVPVRELPPPRASSRVEVTFTKLETDHMPARASREREIREWKRSRRKPGAGDGDGDAPRDVTEREPIFLKDKGDAFFKAGNYRSALEAYTAAVDAEREAPHPDGTLVRLYANRAACYLKGGDAHAAEEDCTSALRLLESEAVDEDSGARWTPDALRAQRLRLITRRARAYVAVDRIDDARRDLEAATRLAPHDATLARDLRDVSACATPLDAAAARGVGDERYRAGDIAGAEAAYAAVIDMSPHACSPEDRAAALANRAACRLSRSDHGAARDDCDDGLDALLRDAGADAARARDAARRSTSQTSLPDASRALLGKLLHRRGAAAAHLRAYDDAAEDYDAAAACATTGPAADALRRDAETVRALARRSEEENATMSVSSPRSVEARDAKMESSGGRVGFRVESRNEGDAVATRWTTTRRGDADARAVRTGDRVVVHAVGSLGTEPGGRVFWNTRKDEDGTPFAYVAGAGEVIPGWDAGMEGCRAGERRALRVPAEEAYGGEGNAAWGIPPGMDVTFDVEVLRVE